MENVFKSIALEVSLKPFKKTDKEFIRETCKGIFEQWRPLLKNREQISIMFWTGDGSEILEYSRDLNKSFEWAYFIGTANLPLSTEEDDPAISLHSKKHYYMENPPQMTYQILKNIVNAFKEEGKKVFPNATIKVGNTFDIGPEFAISNFKYNKHKEISSGSTLDKFGFVDSTSLLNADTCSYAAYPNGIPQDLPFATFLGKQVEIFCKDLGFDYIWLSNGFGFSADPWSLTGKIFDGEHFHADKLGRTSQKVFAFWKMFREACPNLPIETRGTNNSAGIDYATDGVPLWEIYTAGLNITPPPNSPWAALDYNYGLEIMGHMTRICDLPNNEFLFRYYIHDPWWMNSPWYDRYDGAATDIYLPMSVARINERGETQNASRLNILSIDNSMGNMPDSCVYEPLPHLLKAEKDSSDEPSFLLWLYPMKEYTTSKDQQDLFEMYYGDKFIMGAINQGFPLNTVVSTEIFKKISQNVYRGRIIVAPFIHDVEVNSLLQNFVDNGGKLLLYGSSERLASCLINGKNVIKVDISSDSSELRKVLVQFGYDIRFETKACDKKLPSITVNRSNNALFFSIYNPNTTTDSLFKFALGAPILQGCETELVNGFAKYRFSRCEHRECRIFVQQESGIISAREEPPISKKYRRRILLEGLNNATMYYFPEKYCDHFVAVATNDPNATPELDEKWEPIFDDVMGWGFKGEGKNGRISFLMPFKNMLSQN